ncbi:MAG: CerR family C-terminal domain-containing protein [Planctomycetota bacterium]|nr:CerR family C-terminal domain-containing protein [Planctomycetota bacterium]
MVNVKNNTATQETKRKLIDAAGEVFAEVGYERATIKEITDRAGVAIAAVNYHFSDKQELYYQVVRHAHEACTNGVRSLEQECEGCTPEQRLRRFIETILRQSMDDSLPVWRGMLLSREMHRPTAATDRFIEETLRCYVTAIEALLAELFGGPVEREQMWLLANSVMGQCFIYPHKKEILARLYPDLAPVADRIPLIADHIARSTVATARAMQEASHRPAAPPAPVG